MQLNSYLLFDGNAAEVVHFYQSIFGGEITSIQKYGDLDPKKMKGIPLQEEDKQKIMHATLDIKGQLIMFCDAITAMAPQRIVGTNYSICIQPDSKEATDKIFAALSKGGNVKMPLHDAFWGAYFGVLTDKYAIDWIINYQSKPTILLGEELPHWKSSKLPTNEPLAGSYCNLKKLATKRDAEELFTAFCLEKSNWNFLPYGPYDSFSHFLEWLEEFCTTNDPFFYTIFNENNQAVGMASYLRITPEMGVLEVGHIHYSPLLQKTTAATEVMYLMMKNAFENLGYRRYEWKCNNLNESSKKAALRLGFQPEGVFRNAAIFQGRSRDTAWFSILDEEWKHQKIKLEKWLAVNNFTKSGKQKTSL